MVAAQVRLHKEQQLSLSLVAVVVAAAVLAMVEMLGGPVAWMAGITLVVLGGQRVTGLEVGGMLAPLRLSLQALQAAELLEEQLVLLLAEKAADLQRALLLAVQAEAVPGVLAEMGTRMTTTPPFLAVAAALAMVEEVEGVISPPPHLEAVAAAAQVTSTPHSP